mmetsp:Transcript_82998/g.235456  ORF Transcript_82998/g.235456 Transcript_82998/m.235456 type:complete len:91 (-) Transcript_82998:47-319(-)
MEGFNLVSFVTAFHRLAKQGAGPACALSLRLEHRLLSLAPEFKPRECSSIAWAMARMTLQHAPLRQSISSQAIRKLSQFEAQNLVNTAWA